MTERAALAGARWLGRADQEAAEEAASTAMRLALDQLPIDGQVVIGAGEDDGQLAVGHAIGAGGPRSTSRSTRSRAAAWSRAAATTRCR